MIRAGLAAMAIAAVAGLSQAAPTAAPAPGDEQAIAACLAKTGDLGSACIGVVADDCLKTADSTQRMGDCETRELLVWDAWLNRDYARVMAGLDPARRSRLRGIERSFLADRDRRCRFIEAVNGPTAMNGPFIQECALHATAEQWLWLKTFLPDPAR